MLKEFDKITKRISELILSGKGEDSEITKLVKEQDEIVKKLTDDEADELLSRNIPGQYKAKINKIRGN